MCSTLFPRESWKWGTLAGKVFARHQSLTPILVIRRAALNHTYSNLESVHILPSVYYCYKNDYTSIQLALDN